ncbi:leucine-rich repeat-containing protein [Dictyostelium discoideum AX4]|uniref:Leucine-rich repeat-containing protein n=1 Tax=Dictyostelium discoideum TaxID=44689 RepID=Q553C7_DICDI|nr:leucine-rich repeat-containing protein [Dictyostelium discoideum AX4]EAL69680.1 leucine-rich repeat-containing protein [Dictyostelium discoideum AX4]|eukprot:XP_643491.1 leucine-rich repeat-containing protein [Dictyostelium discoideum AX4]
MSSATKLTPDNISFKIGKKIDINSIEELELSSLGFIDATSSFSRLKCLKKLDLSSNRFQLIRNIKGLFDLPVIEDLNLTGNPVTKQNNYRLIVIQNLPTLLILDEKKITATERNQAREFDSNQVAKDPLKKNVDSEEEEEEQEQKEQKEEKVEKVIEKKQQTVKHDESVEEVSKKLDEDLLFGTKSNQKKKLIFEDDEEISLDSVDLSKLEKKPVEKPTKKSILFQSDDEDDDLFKSTDNKTKTKKPINLDDDDLFGDNSGKDSKLSSDFDISSYINSQKSRAKSSLFDD